MKASITPVSFLAFLFLAGPHAFITGVIFCHGAPTEHSNGVCHAAAKKSWTDAGSKEPLLEAPVDVDVVVVAGGHSGMTAARDLQLAGLKTVVLEARNVLGGRSRTISLESGPGIVELGATWINNSTQPNVYALTQEFGLKVAE